MTAPTSAGGGPRFCGACGKPLVPGKRFCTTCGAAVPQTPVAGSGGAAPPAAPAWGGMPGAPTAVPLPQGAVLPHHPAPAVPLQRRRSPLRVVLVALVLLVVAVGAGWGVGRLIAPDDRAAQDAAGTPRPLSDPSDEPSAEPTDDATSDSPTTAPPTTDPTTGPTTEPSAGPSYGPLGRGVPLAYENLPSCDGRFIVVVSSSITPGRYLDDLRPAFAALGDDGSYLSGSGTCPGFHVNEDGSATYVAYLGPFDTRAQACAARGPILDHPRLTGAYVRELNGDTSALRLASLCSCEQPPSQIPPLSRGNAYDAVDTLKARVYDLQVLLDRAGYVGRDSITGVFGDVTKAAVRDYQRDNGLYETGVVTRETWQSLQTTWC